MSVFFLKLVLLVTFLNNQLLTAQDIPWNLAEDTGKMKIYTRLPENSPFKELKITLSVAAPLSKIIAVLDDAENYTNWVYSCSASHTVKTDNKGNFYYYVKFDLPWPLSDRDMIQHSVQTQDSETLVVTILTKTVLNNVIVEKGVVRMTQSTVKWELTPISENLTKIDYSVRSNPGGDIPSWLVNLVVEKGPKETMLKLIDRVKKITVKEDDVYVIDY
ncbi:MAG: hypothetical protein GXO80_07065 [Chlorobi bacterium]|nr:hypothetical protein [Chlorobiota bacterium]